MYLIEDHQKINWDNLPSSLDLIRSELEEVADAMAADIQKMERRAFHQQDAAKVRWMEKELDRKKYLFKLVFYAARFIPLTNTLISTATEQLEYFRAYSWNAYFELDLYRKMYEAESRSHLFVANLAIDLMDYQSSKA